MTRTGSIARIRIELNGIDHLEECRGPIDHSVCTTSIQAVMPFENRHLFLFNVGDKRYGIPDPSVETSPKNSTLN